MYPYSSATVAETTDSTSIDPAQEAVEAAAQAIFSQLEQLPPDVQLAVCTRLLGGLASKLTAATVAKAIVAAKEEPSSAKIRAPGGRRQAAARRSPSDDVPRADSRLRQLNDPTDPAEAWQRFGRNANEVFEILRQEPTGVLEAMLLHRNMPQGPKPRGKSREKLAETIAVRLEQHFRGY